MVDPRFSLANERTLLAWVRTAVALVAGGLLAAKAVAFDHELWRWAVAGPPIVAGGVLALAARSRWARYEAAMRAGERLPVGGGLTAVCVGIAAYAAVVLAATVLD